MNEALQNFTNADASNIVVAANEYFELSQKATIKVLSNKDRESLLSIINKDWDKNNEKLFKNSFCYREEFTKYFILIASDKRYRTTAMLNPEDTYIKNLSITNDAITNPYILNYFNYTYANNIIKVAKDTAIVNKYFLQFISRNSRPDYLKEINEAYQNKIMFSNGMPAPQFKFTNLEDKPITLQSLLGKYVYIDVWATWCGPCKKEIPHLQKLELAYENKNIQFVSISLDEQKNKKNWKDFVTKNKLSGLQLIADSAFKSDFIKKMGIISIPRFILIDPKGKLVAADGLRPSDAELIKIFDKIL